MVVGIILLSVLFCCRYCSVVGIILLSVLFCCRYYSVVVSERNASHSCDIVDNLESFRYRLRCGFIAIIGTDIQFEIPSRIVTVVRKKRR